jgi:transcriptional regulator with XRE-family HTH domain
MSYKGSIPSESARGNISSLLRAARTSIHAQITMLGPFPRLQSRHGRPVTQDEVAEASGLSRQWYASLEQGLPIKVSAGALDRIASVLMLPTLERSKLFTLAIPELGDTASIDGDRQTEESLRSVVDALIITAEALVTLARLVSNDKR